MLSGVESKLGVGDCICGDGNIVSIDCDRGAGTDTKSNDTDSATGDETSTSSYSSGSIRCHVCSIDECARTSVKKRKFCQRKKSAVDIDGLFPAGADTQSGFHNRGSGRRKISNVDTVN